MFRQFITYIKGLFKSNDNSINVLDYVPTTFTIEDTTYPIKETRNGKLYIVRNSRNNTEYWWYIPEKYLQDFKDGSREYINKNS